MTTQPGDSSPLKLNVTSQDFDAKIQGAAVDVGGVVVDRGPKRVALILDASKEVPPAEWQLETEMASQLIEHARQQDRFALLIVGVEHSGGEWLPSSEIRKQLKGLSKARPTQSDSKERTYDALTAAAARMDPPNFGDTIFLFGHPDDSGSSADIQLLRSEVLKKRIRFYGVSFTDPLQEKVPQGFDLNKPLPKSLTVPELTNVSAETGYYFSFYSVRSVNFPGQQELLGKHLGNLYAGIAEPYRLRIDSSKAQEASKLEISVRGSGAGYLRADQVHYQKTIYPCASQSASTK